MKNSSSSSSTSYHEQLSNNFPNVKDKETYEEEIDMYLNEDDSTILSNRYNSFVYNTTSPSSSTKTSQKASSFLNGYLSTADQHNLPQTSKIQSQWTRIGDAVQEHFISHATIDGEIFKLPKEICALKLRSKESWVLYKKRECERRKRIRRKIQKEKEKQSKNIASDILLALVDRCEVCKRYYVTVNLFWGVTLCDICYFSDTVITTIMRSVTIVVNSEGCESSLSKKRNRLIQTSSDEITEVLRKKQRKDLLLHQTTTTIDQQHQQQVVLVNNHDDIQLHQQQHNAHQENPFEEEDVLRNYQESYVISSSYYNYEDNNNEDEDDQGEEEKYNLHYLQNDNLHHNNHHYYNSNGNSDNGNTNTNQIETGYNSIHNSSWESEYKHTELLAEKEEEEKSTNNKKEEGDYDNHNDTTLLTTFQTTTTIEDVVNEEEEESNEECNIFNENNSSSSIYCGLDDLCEHTEYTTSQYYYNFLSGDENI